LPFIGLLNGALAFFRAQLALVIRYSTSSTRSRSACIILAEVAYSRQSNKFSR